MLIFSVLWSLMNVVVESAPLEKIPVFSDYQINKDRLYTARQQNQGYAGSKITVVATDLPGNSSSLSTSI